MKVAICFGTRPEIIKLSLLSKKMSDKFEVVNIFTGQHHSLYKDVRHLIPNIDFSLAIGEYENLSLLYAELIKQLYNTFKIVKPDLVIVQGDTASSYCASFCAFMMGIKVGHVEAGLRTYNFQSPFPEEFNRVAISKFSSYHWCPSELSMKRLKLENPSGEVIFTGNTIVDFVYEKFDPNNITYGDTIIITLHRRENRDIFINLLMQIDEIAKENPDLKFIFPVHPNPIIREQVKILKSKNIAIIDPMKYESFITAIRSCKGIISDSGGIQEEAVCFKKKVLVCRNNTEREESIAVGISRLVGTNIKDNFNWLLSPLEKDVINPYGDGDACKKIINSIIWVN